jgi:hypothetical protein
MEGQFTSRASPNRSPVRSRRTQPATSPAAAQKSIFGIPGPKMNDLNEGCKPNQGFLNRKRPKAWTSNANTNKHLAGLEEPSPR